MKKYLLPLASLTAIAAFSPAIAQQAQTGADAAASATMPTPTPTPTTAPNVPPATTPETSGSATANSGVGVNAEAKPKPHDTTKPTTRKAERDAKRKSQGPTDSLPSSGGINATGTLGTEALGTGDSTVSGSATGAIGTTP